MKYHWQQLNINEKRIIGIMIILIFFMFLWLIIGYLHKNEQIEGQSSNNVNKKIEKSIRKYSRITFFHTTRPICSLAIPEDWEGKYRVVKNNNVIKFLDISNPQSSQEMFYVKKYKINSFKESKNERIIDEDGEDIYVYGLSTGAMEKNSKNKDNYEMVVDINDIIKSFRCH